MSGFVQAPNKDNEKRLSDIKSLVYSLLGKVYLTKPTFFGLDSDQIILVISPSLKILHIGSTKSKNLKDFPLSVDSNLEGQVFVD